MFKTFRSLFFGDEAKSPLMAESTCASDTQDDHVDETPAWDDENAWWSKAQTTTYTTHQENFVYEQYLTNLQYGDCLEAYFD